MSDEWGMGMNGDEWGLNFTHSSKSPFIPIHPHSDEWVKFNKNNGAVLYVASFFLII